MNIGNPLGLHAACNFHVPQSSAHKQKETQIIV